MKGFKFKLQSVLEAREKKFEDCRIEFVKVKNRLLSEKKTLASLFTDLNKTQEGLEHIITTGIMDHTLIFCHQNYISKLKNDIENQQKLIEQTERELEEKNRIMLDALKEKTMMEKLREKAQEAFTKEIERQDLINIDEMAVNRFKKAI